MSGATSFSQIDFRAGLVVIDRSIPDCVSTSSHRAQKGQDGNGGNCRTRGLKAAAHKPTGSRCRDNTHFPHPVHASYAHKQECQEGAPCEVIPSVIPVGEALEKKWVCSLWKQLHQTPGRRRLKLLNFKSRARLSDRTRY